MKLHSNPRFEVLKKQYDGDSRDHYFIQKRDAVLVLLTHRSSVLLIKNSRPNISTDVFFELPGGGIDDEESPAAAAYRELFEETGISDVTLTKLHHVYPLPSLVSERTFIFHGYLDNRPDLQLTKGALNEGISDYLWLELKELRKPIIDGKVKSATDAYALSLALFMEDF